MNKLTKIFKGIKGGFSFNLSDESTAITTGIKYTDSLVFDLDLDELYCNCTVAPTTTSIIVDMLKNGVSMLTNKCIIPIGSKTSKGTGNPSVINMTSILSTDIISFEVLQGDVSGAGLKIKGIGMEFKEEIK